MGAINNETNLTESAVWPEGIYEFQTTDPVQGGPDGLDNKPTRQLANRTQFLRAFCETLANTMAPLLSPTLTGKPTAPTAQASSRDEQLANTAFVQMIITAAISGLINDAPATLNTLNKLAAALGNDPAFATTVINALAAKAPLASPAFTGTPTVPTPPAGANTLQVTNAAFVQTTVNNAIAALINGSPGALDTLNELATALGNDPNFATTVTNALTAKAPLASPAFTGSPTVPTPPVGANTQQATNAAFVQTTVANAIAALINTALGNDANFATTTNNALATKAPLASPAFTGTPTVPTPPLGANTLQATNAAFVQTTVSNAIAALVNAAPGTLDTLKELAAALGNDASFATTMTNALAAKAPLASPALTGTPTAPTPAASDNSNRLSTTANVHATLAQYGLGTNDLSDWVGDLNNLTTSGLWLAATSTNAPNPAISAWFVIVLPNANGAYATQIAMPQSINELWFRAQNAGVWSAWSKAVGSDSPNFTGYPTTPTPPAWSASEQVANAHYVHSSIDLRFPTDGWSYFYSNGWLIQLGRASVANTGAFTTLTFPVAFPNRLVSFVGNLISPGVNVTSVLANGDAATRSGIPVAAYNVGGAGGGTLPIYYIAIGC